MGNFHLNFSFSVIILNLSLFDSSSLLESLAVEADDDDSYDVTEIWLSFLSCW